jgi:DNA-binding transcriptional ArsR family regulator
MDAMIPPRSYLADFVTPTPAAPIQDLEADLGRMRATPEEVIRANTAKMIAVHGLSEARAHFLAHPREAMTILIDEMRLYWERAMAQHWGSIRTLLDNDILYHARRSALGGVENMFEEIDSHLCYENTILNIDSTCTRSVEPGYLLEGRGLQLVPAVFSLHEGVMWMIEQPWKPMIIYRARGCGLWNREALPDPETALRAAFGDMRANMLAILREPTPTSGIARQLGVTAGAVSQQLSRLMDAGLLDAHRSGYRVYYRLSDRGQKLMELFEAG